ncbi:hypothetical protein [Undibacterium sp. Ji22W]
MNINFTGWNRDVRIYFDAPRPPILLHVDAGLGFLGLHSPQKKMTYV